MSRRIKRVNQLIKREISRIEEILAELKKKEK